MIGGKGEIWKDIKGYEGFYQASSLGRIKSLIGWMEWATIRSKRKNIKTYYY